MFLSVFDYVTNYSITFVHEGEEELTRPNAKKMGG
jgi:hypothetical protein